VSFSQGMICEGLQYRRLLCQDVKKAHNKTLSLANKKRVENWKIELGDNLIFDLAGLQAIKEVIQSYQGKATKLNFTLQLSSQAIRDYYSHSIYLDTEGLINLPIHAVKNKEQPNKQETLPIRLKELITTINYPISLTEPDVNKTPLALLMPYSCDHDCLFANQIAIFSMLNYQLQRSPLSWLRGVFFNRKISFKQSASLVWKQVHSSTNIHPTAVIEGSVIGEGCRIGAHCVVRYSILGKNVQLHDGAKVEYSVIDDNSWLMHDLVLYRSLVESDVFLIHGPYQFSFFQKQSAAFASIMMDYRPDNKSIRINTSQGARDYQGRFLGALLEEKAKVFGGTLTSPGITVPKDKQITSHIDNITTAKGLIKTVN
jgi:hypothetical protein